MKTLQIIAVVSMLLIVGCASPTPEPLPTYTPYPTLEPLSTLEPLPTHTPYPTYTAYPTYTSIPKPTDTPLPTATETSEPIPTAMLPSDWTVDENIDGTFTVPHPASWELQSEERDRLTFAVPNGRHATVNITEGGAIVFGGSDEENIRICAGQIADAWAGTYGFTDFKIVDRGVWHGELYQGYYVDFLIYKEELFEANRPNRMYSVNIIAEGHVIGVLYAAFLTDQFTAADIEVRDKVLNAIRAQ